MLEPGAVIEHRQSRPARWLRDHRIRIALWAAVIEGFLLLVHAIPRLPALGIAIVVVALYFWVGHRLRSTTAKEVGWIAAVWQALVMLVPILIIVVGTLALIIVGLLAVVALVLLFSRRG
jgi:hypothetical protein